MQVHYALLVAVLPGLPVPDEGALQLFLAVVIEVGQIFYNELILIDIVGFMTGKVQMQSSE